MTNKEILKKIIKLTKEGKIRWTDIKDYVYRWKAYLKNENQYKITFETFSDDALGKKGTLGRLRFFHKYEDEGEFKLINEKSKDFKKLYEELEKEIILAIERKIEKDEEEVENILNGV